VTIARAKVRNAAPVLVETAPRNFTGTMTTPLDDYMRWGTEGLRKDPALRVKHAVTCPSSPWGDGVEYLSDNDARPVLKLALRRWVREPSAPRPLLVGHSRGCWHLAPGLRELGGGKRRRRTGGEPVKGTAL
jgi:hypothetical protein